METKIIRVAAGKHSTLGHLYIGERFCCYILEDTVRAHKIPGRTAIPAGAYTLGLNTMAGTNARYGGRYAAMHRGMVEVRGIPGFSLVFFHVGNYHTDTAGCLLTGSYWQLIDGDYRVLHSAAAYKQVYPLLVEQIGRGNDRLVITDDFQPVETAIQYNDNAKEHKARGASHGGEADGLRKDQGRAGRRQPAHHRLAAEAAAEGGGRGQVRGAGAGRAGSGGERREERSG